MYPIEGAVMLGVQSCLPSMGLAVGLSVLESGHEGMQLCTPSMTALQILQDLRKFAMTLSDSFRLSL